MNRPSDPERRQDEQARATAKGRGDEDSTPAEAKQKPVWSRRYRIGGGLVEVAVFEHAVDNGGASFTSYATSVKRTYKDGEEYKSARSFRPEDLLPLAHAPTEAFDWIAGRDKR